VKHAIKHIHFVVTFELPTKVSLRSEMAT